jgi:ABC-type Fe3+/spermidine/putrescine transport system ATPase subunit
MIEETAAARPTEQPPALLLRGLRKVYGTVVACEEVDLVVRRGEFVTLLGPSGSGKTTTLRMIAGFTTPSGGSIEIGGRDMTRVPAHRRNVGMVFQNYALFPHMTAAQNIGFPLQMRGVARQRIRERVDDVLELVKLDGFGDRYPRELSGGQQQRIAPARAVVFGPSACSWTSPQELDRKLRGASGSRSWGRSGISATVLLTHDQEEALVMGDRIRDLQPQPDRQRQRRGPLERPTSLFVADFIGTSNILRGRFEQNGDAGGWLTGPSSRLRVSPGATERASLDGGVAAALVVRPERTRILDPDEPPPPDANVLDATVDAVLYLGSESKYGLRLADGQTAAVREPSARAGRSWEHGDSVRVAWAVDDGVLLADPG